MYREQGTHRVPIHVSASGLSRETAEAIVEGAASDLTRMALDLDEPLTAQAMPDPRGLTYSVLFGSAKGLTPFERRTMDAYVLGHIHQASISSAPKADAALDDRRFNAIRKAAQGYCGDSQSLRLPIQEASGQ